MTNVDITKPVIWTTLGNLNEHDCEIYIEWIKNDEEIVFIKHVKYRGETVKREPHVLKLRGADEVGSEIGNAA